jgi:hypothetical protein
MAMGMEEQMDQGRNIATVVNNPSPSRVMKNAFALRRNAFVFAGDPPVHLAKLHDNRSLLTHTSLS